VKFANCFDFKSDIIRETKVDKCVMKMYELIFRKVDIGIFGYLARFLALIC